MRRIMGRKQMLNTLLTGGCLLLLLCLLTVRADAADTVASGYCGGEGDGTNLTWTLDSEGTLTISGTGKMKGYGVYSDTPWYSYKSNLKSLVIENGVTSISDFAFCYCRSFTGDLVIPDSVTSIGSYAFCSCRGFTGSLTIGNSVTSISECAFRGCSGLTGDLVIPDSVTSMGLATFLSCSGLSGNIYFCGDAPKVYEASVPLPSFDTDSVLYYISGTSGWTDNSYYDATTGTWRGYTLKTWTGIKHVEPGDHIFLGKKNDISIS